MKHPSNFLCIGDQCCRIRLTNKFHPPSNNQLGLHSAPEACAVHRCWMYEAVECRANPSAMFDGIDKEDLRV